jgi:hypothetical protein
MRVGLSPHYYYLEDGAGTGVVRSTPSEYGFPVTWKPKPGGPTYLLYVDLDVALRGMDVPGADRIRAFHVMARTGDGFECRLWKLPPVPEGSLVPVDVSLDIDDAAEDAWIAAMDLDDEEDDDEEDDAAEGEEAEDAEDDAEDDAADGTEGKEQE